MPKACAEFNLRLDKRVSVRVEGHKEDLFHLVGELAEAGQGSGRDGREHLGTEQLENFLRPMLAQTIFTSPTRSTLTSYTIASAFAMRPATAGAWTTSRWGPVRDDQNERRCISNWSNRNVRTLSRSASRWSWNQFHTSRAAMLCGVVEFAPTASSIDGKLGICLTDVAAVPPIMGPAGGTLPDGDGCETWSPSWPVCLRMGA